MEYHPDKNKTEGTLIVFQELSEAYSILSDPLKKIEYDQLFQDFFDLAEAFEASGSNEPTVDTSDTDLPDAAVSSNDQEYVGQPVNEERDVFEETNSHDKKGHKVYQNSPEHTPDTYEDSSEEIPEKVPENISEEAPEQTSEKDSEGEDSEYDLDDETLYKVLKFLADNDYVITKRTRKTPVNRGQNFRDENGKFSGYGGYRSYEYRGHPGATGGHFGTPRGPSGAPRSHQGHDHPWTASHQHKPRSGERPAHYSAQFHGSEQVYCKVSTSWEGQVKVTTRTCY